jgi:hypothetical protein
VRPDTATLVRVVSLITETTSIDTSSIPADQFEIPAGWTLKPQRSGAQQRSRLACPTAGPSAGQ